MRGRAASGRPGLYAALRWLDQNAERLMMLPLYAFVALMVGGEAVLRYVTGAQTQWGGTMAIQAFIFLSWLGCAYHVRHRTHLSFDGVRLHLPPRIRYLAYALDDLLWIGLTVIVIVYSLRMTRMQYNFESMVEGTDTIPLWIVTASVPFAWSIIGVRAVQDLVLLASQARRGEFDAPRPSLGSVLAAQSDASKV